jgi:hypothetical protein
MYTTKITLVNGAYGYLSLDDSSVLELYRSLKSNLEHEGKHCAGEIPSLVGASSARENPHISVTRPPRHQLRRKQAQIARANALSSIGSLSIRI